jgi:carbon-monoxide dehydrogenase small subunit
MSGAAEPTRTVELEVNGTTHTCEVPVRKLLADFLREDLNLTGTHVGCEHGVCGACTILVDGESARSCLMLAVQANGRSVTTIEGFAQGDDLHPVQQAFWDKHGLQCGFCTPGMVIAATELLARNPAPSEEQIRTEMAGNICRCTGYHFIVDSIQAAAEAMATEAE